jgi:hypothetical protein
MDRDEKSPALRSVEPIPDPFPQASFGSIGRFVKVECDPEARLAHPRLTISYSSDDLGWVDPKSLRVFAVDAESGEFHLVRGSVPDPERMEVHAFVEESGIYGLIGLPRDDALLRSIRALSVLLPPLGEVDGVEVADLLGMVCGRILCVPPEEGGVPGDLVPPGGVEGDACQFCLERSIPPNGLPEFQLLPISPHRRPRDSGRPTPPPTPGPFLYALLSPPSAFFHELPRSGDSYVEIIDLSTMTSVSVPVGPIASMGITPTPHGLCVLDLFGGNVIIVDPSGGRRIVSAGAGPYDCVASLDGSTLYVSTGAAIVVIDVVAAQVTRTVSAQPLDTLGRVALSPDGRTLAAGTSDAAVYLFDTATLTSRRERVFDPSYSLTIPGSVRFTDSTLLLAWDGWRNRMYKVDAAIPGQLPGVMDDIPANTDVSNSNVTYRPANRGAYVTVGDLWSGGAYGWLVVVDVPTMKGTLKSGFTGFTYGTCLDPRDGKTLYISVENPATGIKLDAYDTQADTFVRGIHTFRSAPPGGQRLSLWDMEIMG